MVGLLRMCMFPKIYKYIYLHLNNNIACDYRETYRKVKSILKNCGMLNTVFVMFFFIHFYIFESLCNYVIFK